MAFCRAEGFAMGAAPAGATSHGAPAVIDAATINPSDLFMRNLLIRLSNKIASRAAATRCMYLMPSSASQRQSVSYCSWRCLWRHVDREKSRPSGGQVAESPDQSLGMRDSLLRQPGCQFHVLPKWDLRVARAPSNRSNSFLEMP